MNTNFTTEYLEKKTGRKLQSNSGGAEGGPHSDFQDTNTYRDNKAAYANDIASYPASFQYSVSQNGFNYDSKMNE